MEYKPKECFKCKLPIPDKYHDFPEECECHDWVERAKNNRWKIWSKGIFYNFEYFDFEQYGKEVII